MNPKMSGCVLDCIGLSLQQSPVAYFGMCDSAELIDTRVEGGHPSLGCGHDEVAFLLLQTGALLNMVQNDIFCLCAKSQMLSQPTISEQVSRLPQPCAGGSMRTCGTASVDVRRKSFEFLRRPRFPR